MCLSWNWVKFFFYSFLFYFYSLSSFLRCVICLLVSIKSSGNIPSKHPSTIPNAFWKVQKYRILMKFSGRVFCTEFGRLNYVFERRASYIILKLRNFEIRNKNISQQKFATKIFWKCFIAISWRCLKSLIVK